MRAIHAFRSTLAALALALVVSFGASVASPALAQQGAPINPTAKSVTEEQLLNALKPGSAAEIGGRVSIPDAKSSTLIRPAGREWQDFHQGTMHLIGGVAIIGMLGLLVLFYLVRGKIRISHGRSPQTITRFNGFERFVHWVTAGTFVVLAFTGLAITFGKALLIPVMGEVAFANMAQIGKYLHNYLSFPFMIGLVLMFLIWVKDNIPHSRDIEWFAMGGGLVGKRHPKAHKFNAGQKVVFWSVILGGAALSVSGVYMLFPYTAGGVLNLQFWNMVHGIVGVLLIAAMLAHAYIGSVGMEGAFDAMGSGEVDLNWAKEHHVLWVDEHMASRVHGRLAPAE
jgi:formate dehydrogenase subunit gamma